MREIKPKLKKGQRVYKFIEEANCGEFSFVNDETIKSVDIKKRDGKVEIRYTLEGSDILYREEELIR